VWDYTRLPLRHWAQNEMYCCELKTLCRLCQRRCCVSDALHDLTFSSHVGIADRTSLTSLLDQRADAAAAVAQAVHDRCAVDALSLADIATNDTTSDARKKSVHQPVQDAGSAGSFGHLSRCIVVHAGGDPADRIVAKTAAKRVLPLSHCDCIHTQHYLQSGQHPSGRPAGVWTLNLKNKYAINLMQKKAHHCIRVLFRCCPAVCSFKMIGYTHYKSN